MAQVKNICTRLTELRHRNLLKRKIRFNIQHWLWSLYKFIIIYIIYYTPSISNSPSIFLQTGAHPPVDAGCQAMPPPCTLHSFEAMHGARSLAALRHGGIRRHFRSEINKASLSSSIMTHGHKWYHVWLQHVARSHFARHFSFLADVKRCSQQKMTKGGMQLVKNQWQGSGQLKWIKAFKEKHVYTKVQADGNLTHLLGTK